MTSLSESLFYLLVTSFYSQVDYKLLNGRDHMSVSMITFFQYFAWHTIGFQ